MPNTHHRFSRDFTSLTILARTLTYTAIISTLLLQQAQGFSTGQTHSRLQPFTSQSQASRLHPGRTRTTQHAHKKGLPFHFTTSTNSAVVASNGHIDQILRKSSSSSRQTRTRSRCASISSLRMTSSSNGATGPPHFVILPGFGNADVDYGAPPTCICTFTCKYVH